jgi:LTXXQ motif family protein
MRTAIKLVTIGTGLATLATAALMLGSGASSDTLAAFRVRAANAANMSSQGKDQARLEPALIQLAQAGPGHGPHPFDAGAGMGLGMGPSMGPDGPPPPRGLAGLFGMSWAGRPWPFGDGTPPSPRQLCEEHINFGSARVAYLKAKLRLQGNQKDAWQKLEQAAEPTVERMREACAQLPAQMGGAGNLPERIDLMARQLAVRVEFLQAIREPLRAVYDTLTPDQRTVLDRPGGRPHFGGPHFGGPPPMGPH